MFAETTACVGTPDMGTRLHRVTPWGQILGDALRVSGVRNQSQNVETANDRRDRNNGEVITYCDPRPPGAGER